MFLRLFLLCSPCELRCLRGNFLLGEVGLFCLRSCILLSAETVGARMRSCRHGLT